MWSGYSIAHWRCRTASAAYPPVDHSRGVRQICLPKHHEGSRRDHLRDAAHDGPPHRRCGLSGLLADRTAVWGSLHDTPVGHERCSAPRLCGAMEAGQPAVAVSSCGAGQRPEGRCEGDRAAYAVAECGSCQGLMPDRCSGSPTPGPVALRRTAFSCRRLSSPMFPRWKTRHPSPSLKLKSGG